MDQKIKATWTGGARVLLREVHGSSVSQPLETGDSIDVTEAEFAALKAQDARWTKGDSAREPAARFGRHTEEKP